MKKINGLKLIKRSCLAIGLTNKAIQREKQWDSGRDRGDVLGEFGVTINAEIVTSSYGDFKYDE